MTYQPSHNPAGYQGNSITNVCEPSGDYTGNTDTQVLNNLLSSGAPLRMKPGIYYLNSMLNVAGSLYGPPAAVNTAPNVSHVMPVVLRLVNGANSHMINITGNNAYVGNIELDGNKAGQSGGFGNGILFDGFFFPVFERLFIHDQLFRGINMVSGVGARILDCSAGNNGDAGIFMDSGSTDETIRGCYINSNGSDGISSAGFVQHIYGNDIWANAGNGVKISGGRSIMLQNNGIDHNQQHGIAIVGPASGSASSVSIAGNSLHSNGLQSNAGFNSVQIDNTNGTVDGVSIEANHFWLDSGVSNKVAYHINSIGAVAAKGHGNQFQAGSSATGTINAALLAKDTNETG